MAAGLASSPFPGTEEQLASLRVLILVLSLFSSLASTLVVLTYIVFAERRKSSTGYFILTAAFAALIMSAFFSSVGFIGDELQNNRPLCELQGAALLFGGLCCMFLWVFIILNIYRRLLQNKDDLRPLPFIVGACILAATLTVIPLVYDKLIFDGVWCFIDNADMGFLLGFFYGWLILCSLVGGALWIAIIVRLVQSLNRARRWTKGTGSEESRPLREGDLSNGSSNGPKNDGLVLEMQRLETRALIRRQIIFVTGFLVLFYSMLINRVMIWTIGATSAGWYLHAVAIGLVGLWLGIVFGITQRNVQLWAGLFGLKGCGTSVTLTVQ